MATRCPDSRQRSGTLEYRLALLVKRFDAFVEIIGLP